MQKVLGQAPFIRFLLPFVVGILVSIFLPVNLPFVTVATIISSLITLFVGKVKRIKYNWIYGVLLFVSLFFFGTTLTLLKTDNLKEKHISKHTENFSSFLVKIEKPLQEKENSFKAICSIRKAKNDSLEEEITGKALVYFEKDSLASTIRYGDIIQINTTFSEVNPPKNPEEFNYKRYLRFHNIFNQAYVKSNSWKKTGIQEKNAILDAAFSARNTLLQILKTQGLTGEEYAVASALILGYKDELNQDLIQSYSSAGATHVLAVSGLHVGIIFLVLNTLLSFMEKRKQLKILKAIILVLSLWSYAFITGLSPSVLRAATMFSFIIIAKATERNTTIYNTLAVSAFVLLLYNPFLITEVGFQLSYLAVLGIVVLQPRIYALYNPKNKIIDWAWTITAVSIAAQIATFPLGLLYFHQFPNYFFVSNLLVIPLATLIVYSGVLVLICSKITFLAQITSKILYVLVWIMNSFVKLVNNVPYSLSQEITISVAETWILYLTICFFTSFYILRKNKYLFTSLVTFLVFLVMNLYETIEQQNNKKMIVYAVNRATAIDFIAKNKSTFLSSKNLINNDNKLQFHIKHNWWALDLSVSKQLKNQDFFTPYLKKQKDHIQFFNKHILLIGSSFDSSDLRKQKYDYIVLSENKYVNLETIKKHQPNTLLIIDSSYNSWRAQKIEKQAQLIGLKTHNINQKGACILDV